MMKSTCLCSVVLLVVESNAKIQSFTIDTFIVHLLFSLENGG
jgi:hypothetical protein